MYGLHLTPTITHAANAGSAYVYGAFINAQAGTNGTTLAQAARFEAGGGDLNYGIQLDVEDGGVDLRIESSADNGDYFQIQTTTHGATTITTQDDDATAAHLTFNVDGNITLDPVGGNVAIDGTRLSVTGSTHITGSSNHLVLKNMGDSQSATFDLSTAGDLTITPTSGLTKVKGYLRIMDKTEDKYVAQIYDSADDGLIAGYANQTLKTMIHANGTSYFTGGPVAIGTAGSANKSLAVSGSMRVSGSDVQMSFGSDPQFQLSASKDFGGGQSLFEITTPTKSNLFNITDGGLVGLNMVPAAFNAHLYCSGAAVVGAPTAALNDANLHTGSYSFHLDEGSNKLMVRVKYSNGTVKSGSILLD
jgi:hypothetical protein